MISSGRGKCTCGNFSPKGRKLGRAGAERDIAGDRRAVRRGDGFRHTEERAEVQTGGVQQHQAAHGRRACHARSPVRSRQ